MKELREGQEKGVKLRPLTPLLKGTASEDDGQPKFKERSATLRRQAGQFQLDPDDGTLKYFGQIGGSDVERPFIVAPSGWQEHVVYAYHDGPTYGTTSWMPLVCPWLKNQKYKTKRN